MYHLLGLAKAINQRLFHLGTSLWLRTRNQQDFFQCHDPNSDKLLTEKSVGFCL